MTDPLEKRGRPLKDPLTRVRKEQRAEAAQFMSLVTKGVPYSAFLDADPPLAVNTFAALRNVGTVDQFFDFDDAAICVRLEISKDELARYRENPHYPKIREALVTSARRLGGARTIDSLAENMEGEVAQELYAMGMLEKSPREKIKALDAFADRRSAKKTRQEQVGSGMVLPERLLDVIKLGLEWEKHLLQERGRPALAAGDEDVIEISASRLNVPAEEDE